MLSFYSYENGVQNDMSIEFGGGLAIIRVYFMEDIFI